MQKKLGATTGGQTPGGKMSTFTSHKKARTSTIWYRQINFSGPSQPGKNPRADGRTNEGKNRVYNLKWQYGSIKQAQHIYSQGRKGRRRADMKVGRVGTLVRHKKLSEEVRQKEQQQKEQTSDSIFARKIICCARNHF